jgi:hypothetical protein
MIGLVLVPILERPQIVYGFETDSMPGCAARRQPGVMKKEFLC